MSRRKIDDLLAERYRGFGPLQKLLKRAGDQRVWTSQLRALLPEPLARDCRVVDVRGNVAIIACGSAGSATRLRFMAPGLLADLTQLGDFRGVTTLSIRVSSAHAADPPPE
ncbi:MAG: DUF721 domain-containing protein [Pseudomonadales bacterium]|nr:DUF721 domain-containing protein [Pseudomonadales bacterium]